jgi:phage terminase large subunit-like protein
VRWMVDSIYIKTDPAGNIKPDKEKSTEKFDGAVATIMALDRALRHTGDAARRYMTIGEFWFFEHHSFHGSMTARPIRRR